MLETGQMLEHRRAAGLLRMAIGVFVALTCLRVWVGPQPLLGRAEAQIPDAGLQRKQLVDETLRTNQLLSDIKRILESETLKVRVQSADN